MDTLKGQRSAHVVIDILAQVQFLILGNAGFLKRSLHRNDKVVQTSVARHCHRTLDVTGHINGGAVIDKLSLNTDIRIKDVFVAESCKELTVRLPGKFTFPRGQTKQFNYKGLQS